MKDSANKSPPSGSYRSARGRRAQARTQAIVNAPIQRTLLRLTLPMMFAIVSLMLLGVVDSYFVGKLGLDELAALGFTLPIVSAAHSIALGLGMALSVICSRLLGSGDVEQAARTISDGRYLTIVFALLILLVLWFALEPLFRLMGAGPEVMPHVRDYMFTWLPCLPVIFLNMTGNTVLRAVGSPAKSAIVLFAVALINGILDPLLIFGWGPVPQMGMVGAAMATVLAWLISYGITVWMLGYQEKLLLKNISSWRTLLNNWRKLMVIGIPAVSANLFTPLGAAILTTMVAGFGTSAVAGFGVAIRIEAVCLLVAFALSSTLPMFIGQNLGAGRQGRARQALNGSLIFVLVFQAAIYVVLLLLPSMGSTFSSASSVAKVIDDYLLLVPLSYGGHAVVILVMVSLNAMHQPRIALAITVLRLMTMTLPFAFIGSQFYGISGLFVGYAVGNVTSAVMAYLVLQRAWRKVPSIE